MKINYANKKLASYIAPIGFILSVALAISLFLSSHKSDGASTTNSIELGAMEQVWQFVDKYFYDQNFNGVEWESILNRYLVNASDSQQQEVDSINRMLAELEASHTAYYTSDMPGFYQLLGIFLPNNAALREEFEAINSASTTKYTGIGIFTRLIGQKRFVSGVLHGGPADVSGLLLGDEIVAVNEKPFHPIQSFDGELGKTVNVRIRRTANSKKELVIKTEPKLLDGATMFLDALQESVEIVNQNNLEIGYVRVWSFAGKQYQAALEQLLLYGRLKDVDALVLDLRGGWGGGNASDLNLFRKDNILYESIGGEDFSYSTQSAWTKPVVLLTDGDSRSGKEVFAYGFKKYGIGKIVGQRTAGSVLGGAPFFTDEGGVLYLAVGDVILDNNVRLEGVGVEPDIQVPLRLAFAAGFDPQKKRAIAEAVKAAIRQAN